MLIQASSNAQNKRTLISPGVRFDQYFSTNGLPDNRVRNLFQDSKGYLWIGTMNGLCRFDGYSFRKFLNKKAPNGITSTWAYAIAEDDDSDLYIGTHHGLSKFIRSTESFVPVTDEKASVPKPYVSVTSLLFKNRQLWIGTESGLFRYDPAAKKHTKLDVYPLNLRISKIISSQDDYIWIATNDGIVRLNTRNSAYQFFRINIKPNPYGDKVWSMLEDNRSLFIGTGGDGLIKLPYDSRMKTYGNFDHLNQKFANGESLAGQQVFDLVKSRQGDLWLATEEGLGRISNLENSPTLEFFRKNPLDKNSISNNIIYKLLLDQTGVLWCGTELGLNKSDLNLLAFRYFTFSGNSTADLVRSIASANGDDIFLGTASSGLFKYNLNTGDFSVRRSAGTKSAFDAYRSLYISKGAVWAGTLGGALMIPSNDISSKASVYNDHATFATLRDSKGNLWIGTNRGLFKQDAQGRSVDLISDVKVPTLVKTGFVRQIFEDSRGYIWLGFENGGLVAFDPKNSNYISFSSKDPGKQISGTNVITITEYPENAVWVGTEAGLNKLSFTGAGLKNWSLRTFGEEDGLPDKSVNGMLASENGFIWLSTIKGLARLDVNKNSIQTYLSNVNFSIGSCYKAGLRQLLFGTSNGFIEFDPFNIPSGGKGPVVIVSELKLFNQPVEINQVFNDDVILDQSLSFTKEIVLNYHNNVFSIGFTALDYANPEENSYSYKMEGFDDNWISADASSRTATYTNLDPGTYYFKVRAATYLNNWSREPAQLKITILPPPWKTWWAITLYIILFNLLLWVFIRYVLIQSRQRQEIEYQKLEKEQLRQLNEMKVNFFTNISHEFRTPLTLISAPVEELLHTSSLGQDEKSKVNFIYRNCRKLLSLLDELMTFQKAEQGMLKLKMAPMNLDSYLKSIYINFQPLAERNKVSFQYVNTVGDAVISFDPDKMEMVLNNLISNALKFTQEGGLVSLKLSKDPGLPEDKYLSIAVEDNGKGIQESELPHIFERYYSEHNKNGTGVGLALTKNLVELHQGTIEVSSVPSVLTSFRIHLPYMPVTAAPNAENTFVPEFKPLEESMDEAADGNRKTGGKYKLLIVDDNKEILDYLQLLFDGRYEIARAVNGRDALDKLALEEPDLIISDLMMPEMDGREFCKAVKSDVNTSHIPFILLTAKATDDDKLLGLQTGADDYIPKPFHPEILKVRAEKMIEYQYRLKEKYKGDGVVIPKEIARNPLDEKFLQKVLDTINANMSNDEFSVEDLGEAVFMSRSHLFRKLKAITGQTPIELIYQVRIKHSMELLLERKLSISEIAYEVGFKNPSSFTSSFKKQYGKSPKEYLNDVLKGHHAGREG